MRTITLQGTQEEFSNLYQNVFDEDEIPQEVKIRVYTIDTFNLQEQDWNKLTDDEFMTLAEKEGNVYTLEGFKDAFNNSDVNSEIDVIRFISVRLF